MTHHSQEIERTPSVAVLGLGPMGRALAAASLAAGHPTAVWNRTPGKVAALRARGATLASTAVEAAEGASVVITCVIDYKAARAAVAELAGSPARTLVNLSSGHAAQARDFAAWAAQRGISYLDGAILTPAPTIGTPAAKIVYSGPQDGYARSLPVVASFGGFSAHLGEDPGIAAAYEMALLDLFAMSVAGMAHAFALAATQGIPPAEFGRFAGGIGSMLPGMADRFAEQLTAGSFTADVSSIASARSAVAHVVEAAAVRGIDTAPLRAVQSIIERAASAGHGNDSYARLAQMLLPAGRAAAVSS